MPRSWVVDDADRLSGMGGARDELPHGRVAARHVRALALRNKWFRKKIAWHLWQAAALQQAACFHATAENECESVRRLGFRQPVSVIPSGVDVPEMSFSPRTPGRPGGCCS